MTTISTPKFYDNNLDTAEVLSDIFYTVALPRSFEAINGSLDYKNLNIDASQKVGFNYIQRGALTGGATVAGTANLDYFSGDTLNRTTYGTLGAQGVGSGFFDRVGGDPSSEPERYLPIPGASVQFYLPFRARVLFTWSVTWCNDGVRTGAVSQEIWPDGRTDIALFIDGKSDIVTDFDLSVSPFNRDVQYGVLATGGTGNQQELMDRYKSRTYSGHCFTDGEQIPVLEPGYHSASLRLSQSTNVKQGRVRARSMSYMYFKYSGEY